MSPLIQPPSPKLQEAFLTCHADGHQWRHEGFVGAPEWTPPFGMSGAIARHSLCTSCGAERARWYTRSGEVQNRYRHPDGYLHKRADPEDLAPSRLDYRKRLVVTLFADFTAAQPTASKRKRSA